MSVVKRRCALFPESLTRPSSPLGSYLLYSRRVISHHHRAIFVHIPKCGGQSVETTFLSDLGLDWDNRDALNLRKNPNSNVGPDRIAHLTLPEYLELHYVNPEQIEAYFVFTMVRDPVERLFSAYRYLGHARVMTFDDFVTKRLPALLACDDAMVRPAYQYLGGPSYAEVIDAVFRLEDTGSLEVELTRRFGTGFSELPHVNSHHERTGTTWSKAARRGLRSTLMLGRRHGKSGLTEAPRGNARRSNRDTSSNLTVSALETIIERYWGDFERFGYPIPQPD